MDDRFFRAWIHRKDWRICGRRLQPLCLGHLINLHAVRSPLLPEADDIDLRIFPADLLIAARICSEPWPHPGNLRPRLRDVLWRLALERFPRLFRRQLYWWNAYFSDFTSFPEFWNDESGCARTLTAPAMLSKAAFLVANTNLTEARIWSMPLARVDFYIAAILERQTGDIRFLWEGDLEDVEQPEAVLTEEQIIAQARADLPADRFASWLAARRKRNGDTVKGGHGENPSPRPRVSPSPRLSP